MCSVFKNLFPHFCLSCSIFSLSVRPSVHVYPSVLSLNIGDTQDEIIINKHWCENRLVVRASPHVASWRVRARRPFAPGMRLSGGQRCNIKTRRLYYIPPWSNVLWRGLESGWGGLFAYTSTTPCTVLRHIDEFMGWEKVALFSLSSLPQEGWIQRVREVWHSYRSLFCWR